MTSTTAQAKNTVAETITKRFMDAIVSTGTLPWQKPWKSVFLRNATTGRPYHGVNVMMLALFGRDTDYITFNQAKERGGMVRKGSKGLPVIYCRTLEKKDKTTGLPIVQDGKPAKYRLLRYSTVFNLSDIDGCDALKAKCTARKSQITFSPIEACERLAADLSSPITHGGDRACYIPAIHVINMPARESFHSVEAYYCTLFHEIGHSMSRENGEDISNGFGTEPYAKEELVAELFANFCLSYAGIDSSLLFNNSLAYLQNWQKRLADDSGLLISAASKASARFNLLLKRAGLLEDEDIEAEDTAEDSAPETLQPATCNA